MDKQTASRDATNGLRAPNQLFLYYDLVQPQYVGDTVAPLLRNLHVDKTNLYSARK
jgi:hypothetical protein